MAFLCREGRKILINQSLVTTAPKFTNFKPEHGTMLRTLEYTDHGQFPHRISIA